MENAISDPIVRDPGPARMSADLHRVRWKAISSLVYFSCFYHLANGKDLLECFEGGYERYWRAESYSL